METGLYYLQSRYYDPEMGRFINADNYYSTGQGLLGDNMFAYCYNNPLMFCDYNGLSPTGWQWAISGAMVLVGVGLVATGVGGAAGGALICAGANSIIGSYISEASGGTSVAGWFGGMATGAICGAGAGVAGAMFEEATTLVGGACLGSMAASGATAFGMGAAGSAVGQSITASIDGKKIKTKDLLISSATSGAINCLSAIGAGMGTALQHLPKTTTTSTTLANSLNAAWSVVVESVCDLIGTISSILPW